MRGPKPQESNHYRTIKQHFQRIKMKSLKVRLEFNNAEQTLASQHAGAARYAYNWGLEKSQKAIESGAKRPSAIQLHKDWVVFKHTEATWAQSLSKCAPQEAFRNLAKAYQRSFQMKGVGRPRFKKKGQNDSFYLEGNIRLEKNRIQLPKLGWVTCSETLPNGLSVKNVTVSRHAHHWFVSFKVHHSKTIHKMEPQPIIGADLGVKTLVTLSDGQTIEHPRPYRHQKRKLRFAQRQASKKYISGKNVSNQSKNYQKAQAKVAKIHYKIACIRKNVLHQVTTRLAKNHSEVVIEDLNVKGMSRNHKIASAILDGGFYEFRRQLTYKCDWYGSKLTIVDRFYPSSKTCSDCQKVKKKLSLNERTYCCEHCGLTLDRDLNAAINLRNQAVSYTASACGVPKPLDDCIVEGSVKQEADCKLDNVQDCVSSA
jgi:putative transposase